MRAFPLAAPMRRRISQQWRCSWPHPVRGTSLGKPTTSTADWCPAETASMEFLPGIAGVGDEAGAVDAVNRTGFIVLGSVAADPDSTEDVARSVADQHAARYRDDAAARGGAERLDKGRVGGGAPGEFAPTKPHPQGAPRLAAGDLRPQQARTILAFQRREVAASVEHRHGQRLEAELAALLQRLVDDDRGPFEGQHWSALRGQCAVWRISPAQRSRTGRISAAGAEGSVVTTRAMP